MPAMVFWFEGPDMCGKSTQIRELHKRLEKDGLKVLSLKEPGGSSSTDEIRKILLNTEVNEREPLDYLCRRALYLADHLQKLKIIYDERHNYDIILCDRYSPISDSVYGFMLEEDNKYKDIKLTASDRMRSIVDLSTKLYDIDADIKHNLFLFSISETGLIERINESTRDDEINIYDNEGFKFKIKIRDLYEELENISKALNVSKKESVLKSILKFFDSKTVISADRNMSSITMDLYHAVIFFRQYYNN